MIRKILFAILVISIIFPGILFAQSPSGSGGHPLITPAGNFPVLLNSEEDKALSPKNISGRTKLMVGLSLSITGTGLTIIGEVLRPPYLDAKSAYENIDILTASVSEIEAARTAFIRARFLHFSTLISGLSMTGIGLIFTIDGALHLSIYDDRPYNPKVDESAAHSAVIISPAFTGLNLRL